MLLSLQMLYYAADENEDFSDSEQNRFSSDAILINQYSSFYNNLFSLRYPRSEVGEFNSKT